MPEFPRSDFRLHVGWRNIKTSVTAMLAAMIYCLIGRNPAFACIGVIFGLGYDMEDSIKNGGNRQELHERLRVHSHAAAAKVKLEGGANDLIDRIVADPAFKLTREEIEAELSPELYIGRCPSQVAEFIGETAQPIIDKYLTEEVKVELKV